MSKGFTAQWMTRGSEEAGLALSWFTESVFCFSGVRQDISEVLSLFKPSSLGSHKPEKLAHFEPG